MLILMSNIKGYQRILTYETINTFERDEYQQQAPSHEYPRPSRHVKGNQQPWYHGERFSNWYLSTSFAKSLFMSEIEKGMRFEVYYTEGAAITKAGLQKFIAENPHKEIIIIDEIDKMPIQHQEGLLTMMRCGEFTTTKVRNTQTVRANMVILQHQKYGLNNR